MLKKLDENIISKSFFNRKHKLLIGVSGGADSVVLLDMLNKLGYSCSIAHCNFNLRGKESDQDEEFVTQLSKKYNVSIYKKSFNTIEYAKKNNLSIEMAARDLRYEWFDQLIDKYSYDFIAIAHHKDDLAETFFLNLVRGTGIRGLRGIQEKNNKIVRPFLIFSRQQIIEYAHENNLHYKTDSTNKDIKYIRNKIRHEIIPLFNEINPSFNNTMFENVNRLKEVEQIYEISIKEKLNNIKRIEKEKILFNKLAILNLNPIETFLYEFIKEYGFNNKNVKQIVESLDTISGKQFFSKEYKLLIDRDNIVITKLQDVTENEFILNKIEDFQSLPIDLTYRKILEVSNYKIKFDKNIACIDGTKLTFPLKIRKWKEGDYFYPLGMKKRKKLSDFFIDNKLSLIDKQDLWILEKDDEIVWIIGYRIDDRYKVVGDSGFVVEIEKR